MNKLKRMLMGALMCCVVSVSALAQKQDPKPPPKQDPPRPIRPEPKDPPPDRQKGDDKKKP
jgi:hypothetical protein